MSLYAIWDNLYSFLVRVNQHARNDAIPPPPPPPKKEKGIGYSECFYTENMADNVKGNYVGKFLEAIDFAFKKCNFNFVSKAEQLASYSCSRYR